MAIVVDTDQGTEPDVWPNFCFDTRTWARICLATTGHSQTTRFGPDLYFDLDFTGHVPFNYWTLDFIQGIKGRVYKRRVG